MPNNEISTKVNKSQIIVASETPEQKSSIAASQAVAASQYAETLDGTAGQGPIFAGPGAQ